MMMITNIQTLAHVMYLSLQGNGIKLTVQKCAILRIFAHDMPVRQKSGGHRMGVHGLDFVPPRPPAPAPP